MKEWCIQHPWMTFFTLNFFIWIIMKNIVKIFEGKKEYLENLNIKGGIKMPNKNQTPKKNNGGRTTQDGQKGSQSVPPTTLSSPGKPPKQK